MNNIRKLIETIEQINEVSDFDGPVDQLIAQFEATATEVGIVDDLVKQRELMQVVLARAFEGISDLPMETISEGPIVEPNDEWVARLGSMKELIENFEWRMEGMAYQAKIQGHSATAASLINIEADVNHIKKLFDAAKSDLEKEYDRPGGWPTGFDN